MNNSLPDFLYFSNDSVNDSSNLCSIISKEELVQASLKMQQEIKFYKNLIYCGSKESEPHDGVVVVYFENEFSKKYKSKIDHFFDKLFSKEEKSNNKNSDSDSRDQIVNACIKSLSKPKKHKSSSNSINIIGKPYSVHYSKSFTISNIKRKSSRLSPPRYFIKSDTPVKKTPNQPDRRSFNKRRFLCDPNIDDSFLFNEHQPGQISSNLQRALGLQVGELPVHICRMRIFGYPPGWEKHLLKTARGAISVDQVISYPGFNVPPKPNSIDFCSYFQCPQFSFTWSRENYCSYLADHLSRIPLETPSVSNTLNETHISKPKEESEDSESSSDQSDSDVSASPVLMESTLIRLGSTLLIKGEKPLPPIENFSHGLMPLVLEDDKEGASSGYARCMKVLGKKVKRKTSD